MSERVKDSMGKGISAEHFIAGMKTNRKQFLDFMQAFRWKNESERLAFVEIGARLGGASPSPGIRCLLLAADWCGDVVRNVPVLFQVLGEADIPVEVFIIEQHPELMDDFLTMGGRAIPIAIFADSEGKVEAQWGPRPAYVQAVMKQFKEANPDRTAADYQEKLGEVRKEMIRRYDADGHAYQQWIVDELRELLQTITFEETNE